MVKGHRYTKRPLSNRDILDCDLSHDALLMKQTFFFRMKFSSITKIRLDTIVVTVTNKPLIDLVHEYLSLI